MKTMLFSTAAFALLSATAFDAGSVVSAAPEVKKSFQDLAKENIAFADHLADAGQPDLKNSDAYAQMVAIAADPNATKEQYVAAEQAGEAIMDGAARDSYAQDNGHADVDAFIASLIGDGEDDGEGDSEDDDLQDDEMEQLENALDAIDDEQGDDAN